MKYFIIAGVLLASLSTFSQAEAAGTQTLSTAVVCGCVEGLMFARDACELTAQACGCRTSHLQRTSNGELCGFCANSPTSPEDNPGIAGTYECVGINCASDPCP